MMPVPTGAYVRTSYMSRRVDLPPLVAQAAYDSASASDSHRWLLLSRTARLHLSGQVLTYSQHGWWPLRSQLGTLTVGVHRWRIELELLAWSSSRTELGLRPLYCRTRSWPPESIYRAGFELLDRLDARLHSCADQPLREWSSAPRAAALPRERHGIG